jgi:hypothetical protein
LVERDGETELTLRHACFENAEETGPHEQGWESALGYLGQALAARAA